jgi:hypothetical protein
LAQDQVIGEAENHKPGSSKPSIAAAVPQGPGEVRGAIGFDDEASLLAEEVDDKGADRKLKKPHNAIAGFGFFAGFSVLHDWLAWETFGDANGVDSLEALRARLHRIREGARIEADSGLKSAHAWHRGTARVAQGWKPRSKRAVLRASPSGA